MVRCLVIVRDFYCAEASFDFIRDDATRLGQPALKILAHWVRIGRLSRLLDDQYRGFLGIYGGTERIDPTTQKLPKHTP